MNASVCQRSALLWCTAKTAVLVHSLTGANNEAIKYAERALQAGGNVPAVNDTLGWACYQKGRYDLAVQHLETAVKGQTNPKRKCHLAMAYYKVGDDKHGQVLAKEALKEDPKLAETAGEK